MEPTDVLLLLGGLIIGATLLGFAWQVRQGRVSRGEDSLRPPEVPLDLLDTTVRFTLLQFSGPFCSYCQAMRTVLGTAAAHHEGVVAHREIDVTDYPDLTHSLKINQTPTTLIVTHTGHVVSRIHGAAKPPVVEDEITLAIASRKAASDEYLI
jgi:thiol-disulfide isomerase/thioredoxin